MTYRVVVRRLAEFDLAEARDWYDEQRPGLGSEFLEAVNGLFQRVSEDPKLCPIVEGSLRRAVLRRFPYLVYFSLREEDVLIVACLHSSRHPDLVRTRWSDDWGS